MAQLRVTYLLSCVEGEHPEAKAREIAYEQTVELPPECVEAEVARRVVGRVEQLRPAGEARWETVIGYPALALGEDATQLLNALFGNISLKSGIRITNIEWPDSVLGHYAGPWYGIDGLRWLCGVSEPRPLVCGALKPMGLSSEELARLCSRMASQKGSMIDGSVCLISIFIRAPGRAAKTSSNVGTVIPVFRYG